MPPEAEARMLEDIEMGGTCGRNLRVHHLTKSTATRILQSDRKITYASVTGSDSDEHLKVFIRAETMEACLYCEIALLRAQVDEMSKRTQGASVPPRDDCVVVVIPLKNLVRMTDDGRAILLHRPDNQVIIEYPRHLDRIALRDDREEVLQTISVVTNVKSIEATEQADIVTLSTRFFHNEQGEAVGHVMSVADDIVDLCHGAKDQNHRAVEARKGALET